MIRDIFNRLPAPTRFPKIKYKPVKNKLMAKVNIHDLHFGKLCWKPETGENYDSKIAAERFMSAINHFIHRVKGLDISEVWFPVGNDFFNSDGHEMTTTAGTAQHDDGRWQKTYEEGCRLLINGIEMLRREVGPVKVYNVGGNHDRQKSFYATLHIDAYFRNTSDVEVDCSPAKHKCNSFGNVVIMDTHGDKIRGGIKEMDRLFISLYPKQWCDSEYKEVHLGHYHHETSLEKTKTKIRVMPSMSGTDAWHTECGYVGNIGQCQLYLYDFNLGLDSIINYTVKV